MEMRKEISSVAAVTDTDITDEEAGAARAPEVLYWENTEGGHGGAADNKQRAYMWALTYNFLAQALGLEPR